MKWHIVADFFESEDARWLDDCIESPNLSFTKVVARKKYQSWHAARLRISSLSKWISHFRHSLGLFRLRPRGIVTCFPQLAMSVGLLKRLTLGETPIVAYNFNLGLLPLGMKRRIARFAAPAIDHFVVHSPAEIALYANYLNISADRFTFVPLQRPFLGVERDENTERPFVLAMGSAHRDYATLIKALEPTPRRTIIVAREDLIDKLPKYEWIEYLHGLSSLECMRLLSRSRISVTPVSNMSTASGQITFINAMRIGVPVIATRCPGTEGYIQDGKTGLLVEPFSEGDLRRKIDKLWENASLRSILAEESKISAAQLFSDAAAAKQLEGILLAYSR